MVSDRVKTGLIAAGGGLALYLTGCSVDNETAQKIMAYLTEPEYVKVASQYAGLAKVCGLATMAAGGLGAIVNGIRGEPQQPGGA